MIPEHTPDPNLPLHGADTAAAPARISFWRRLGAHVLDSLFLALPSTILDGPILPTIAVLYYFLSEGLTGQTLGKKVLRIAVGNADASRPTIRTLLLRTALKANLLPALIGIIALVLSARALAALAILLILIYIIGCLFVFDKPRQAFHDMIAKTAVYWEKDLR